MFAKDLKKETIIDNSYESVFLGRRAARMLDSTHKVSREEIEEIINEAMVATPTAIDTNPYKLLVIVSDEAKKKVDDIMYPVDKSRVLQCSFAIIPLADRRWIDHWDDIVEANKEGCRPWYDVVTSADFDYYGWYEGLVQAGVLDRSITFQAGLVSMSLMIAARAHGLDTGFLDGWEPDETLEKALGVDLSRYIPQGVICFGKNVGPMVDCYRMDIDMAAEFL